MFNYELWDITSSPVISTLGLSLSNIANVISYSMVPALANIGIYIFRIKVLIDNVLKNDNLEFTLNIKHYCEKLTVTPPSTIPA